MCPSLVIYLFNTTFLTKWQLSYDLFVLPLAAAEAGNIQRGLDAPVKDHGQSDAYDAHMQQLLNEQGTIMALSMALVKIFFPPGICCLGSINTCRTDKSLLLLFVGFII